MITEAVITWFISAIGHFLAPLFDSAYSSLGIDSTAARLMVPRPLFFVIETYTQYAVVLMPIALGWWIWRQVKA